jgi:alcohol dehydrogenase YqhD (iron-dependent ADH family)
MNTFQYHNPTRLIFGKGQVNVLGKEIREFGKRVLLVYGGGSIKRSGLFERIVNQLNEGGMAYFECPDVEPNPLRLREG